MTKNEFFISCREQELHCVEWRPDGAPVAVLQIVHGMAEHILRYGELAEYLNGAGIAVVGHDHPGHGKTAKNEGDLGYIPKKGGSQLLVDCTVSVTEHIKKEYPEVPLFILGHSMGSFVLRRYLTAHASQISGAIVVGTGTPQAPVLSVGRLLASLLSVLFGAHHRSPLLKKISFAGYNSQFSKDEGENAWISSDREAVRLYDGDPLSGYTFTASGFYVLYDTLLYLAQKKGMENIPKDLPVFVAAGELDPVGSMGKGPRAFAEELKRLGVGQVELMLYKNQRHEIINERERAAVHADIKHRILKLAGKESSDK